MKNKAGLVALLVLVVATLLMVFLVLPNINTGDKADAPAGTGAEQDAGTTPAEGGTDTTAKQARDGNATATDPAAGETAQADDKAETPADAAASATASGPASDSETATAADPAADWTVPAFDVLRVEPDGSTVIAGRAEPNKKLEILNGDTVIATTDVGPSGDFAAVFDKPLIAGDYQLTLKVLGEGGASKTSEEVATVSVPKDEKGELLAMVSKPGKASRLITVPEGEPTAADDATATETAKAATDTATESGNHVADTAQEPVADGDTATAGQPAATSNGEGETAAGTEGTPATDTETDQAAAADAASDAATDTADAAATESSTAASETQTAAGATADGAADSTTPGDVAALDTGDKTDNAAATPGQATSGARPPLRVSAVEIEGDKMFVAGNAKPGAVVRIYANDRLVGEMKADETGNYVVDGTIALPVGRHTIRADVMSPDGARVELRASVPFDRPAGDQVAVVARDDAAPAGTTPAFGLIGGGTFDKLRADADKAVSLLSGLYADGRLPSVEELAAARSATEIALKRLADFRPAANEGEEAAEMAAKATAAAADALARLQALPKDVAAVGEAVGAIETAVRMAVAPATEATTQVADIAASASQEGLSAIEGRARDLQGHFKALFADGRNATAAEIQTARTAFEAALHEIDGFALPEGAGDDVAATLESLKTWARTCLAGLASVPANAGKEAYAQALIAIDGVPAAVDQAASGEAVAIAAAEGGTAADDATPSATASDSAAATAETSDTTGADSATTSETETASAAGEPETVEQAPLEESKSSVIIRRGDTLWQISRRVYGKGVRYTTIYLANQDQIQNPDQIQPGQIFGVPEEAAPDPEAEAVHRRRVQGG